jgi:hypothetical protein
MRLALTLTLILATSAPAALQGQIVPIRAPNPNDTVTVDPFRERPPVSPVGAALRSLLIPGWGQSVAHRRATGAFFVLFEGISLTMTLKSRHQLGYLESVQSEDNPESIERVDAKRAEIQDWAILLAFNHLMAAAEAFVSTMLWDFPEELEVRAFSGGRGRFGARITLPLP